MLEPVHPVPDFGTPDVAAIVVDTVPLCALCNDHGTLTAATLLLPCSSNRGQLIQWTPVCAACAAGWDDDNDWVGHKFALVPLRGEAPAPPPGGDAAPCVIVLRDRDTRRTVPVEISSGIAGNRLRLKIIDHRSEEYTEVLLTARRGELQLTYSDEDNASGEGRHRLTLIRDTAVLAPFEVSAANRRDAEAVAVLHQIARDSAEFRLLLGHAAAGVDITAAAYRRGLTLARSAAAQS